MEASRHPVLFLNPRSGGGRAVRAGVIESARERGIEVVELEAGQSLAALASEAVAGGADALGVSGGDGSLAIVAAAAVRHGLPFVCVPGGTRNHFALDVGIDPHDLVGALDAFADGVEHRVDVAEVNGQVFLNNVSLGVYGDAVRQPTYREAKLQTLAATVAEVLGPSGAATELQLVDDAGRVHASPAVVLVSNNPYAFNPPQRPGRRPTLESGRLGVIVLHTPAAGPTPARTWTAADLEVTGLAAVHAGVDGEAVDLTPPLRFVVRPAALRVRIPPGVAARPAGAAAAWHPRRARSRTCT